ncbi:MAG: ChaN family lipoprotein [Paracoccaceae bacterium]
MARFLPMIFLLSGVLPAVAVEDVASLDWNALLRAEVVIIGEVHDNHHHHDNQALIVARLRPKAVVFEMVPEADEEKLRQLPAARRTEQELSDLLRWEKRGWPDFSIYWPVFEAVGNAALFGAEQPRASVRAAYDDGAASAFGESAASFGLDKPLPAPEADERMAEQMEAHCNALPEDTLPHMVEAQRFRDAELSRAVLRALREKGRGPVVLITGNGHARRDWGVPALLRIAAPGLDVVAIGQFEEEAEPGAPFDGILVTPTVPRADPCEAFRGRND